MHVACASDEGYLPHCAAMLISLLEHNPPEDVTVHFMHGPAMPEQLLEKLAIMIQGRGASVVLHEIADESVSGLQSRAGVAGVMWYRVLLPQLVPRLDRILYLDVDLLVLDSLKELWDIELGDTFAAAVPNVFEPRFTNRPKQLGMRSSHDYFNSGLLVLNLAAMRLAGLTEKILTIARERSGELKWQDQDPLNIAFNGNWTRLHPRWNSQNSLYFFPYGGEQLGVEPVQEALAHPAIVHFEGPDFVKPWHRLCKHPYQGLYLSYRRQTPWPDVKFNGNTFRNSLLRLLPHKVMVLLLKMNIVARRCVRF